LISSALSAKRVLFVPVSDELTKASENDEDPLLRTWTISVRADREFARDTARLLRQLVAERPFTPQRKDLLALVQALERADRIARTEDR
jgi:hypothetical protein